MIAWLLRNRLVAGILAILIVCAGVYVSPFSWQLSTPRNPVAVDALPNLGENQQIVFTEWPGRSPQDVEDQVSYPLTVNLMGVAGVKDVRSVSMFGFSSIAVIFEEDVDFYWSRTRILEKISSMPSSALPAGVQPQLGPDATGLGQVFWYTIEGRNRSGQPVGGWDLDEIRSVQDWYVRYGLMQAEGVSEVASVGGFVREYQVDVHPQALREYGLSIQDVENAVRQANLEVGAGNTEINGVDYLVRGEGFITSLEELRSATVKQLPNHRSIRISDVATVSFGPARRRGALDVDGAEAVGGVVTVREGANPYEVIQRVQEEVQQIGRSLPAKAIVDWRETSAQTVVNFAQQQGLPLFPGSHPQADDSEPTHDAWANWLKAHPERVWPEWLSESQLTIVPFYDRSDLIQETLGTLENALSHQLWVTAAVVLLLLLHFRSALAISAMLPLAVLLTFAVMKVMNIEANIVALAGIAIAIGTIVDMAIIVTENVYRHARGSDATNKERTQSVARATKEVAPAVFTAIITTVISFIPVFALTGAEGKLFTPLAYTKTIVLLASVLVAVVILPSLLRLLLSERFDFVDKLKHKHHKVYRVIYALLLAYIGWVLAGAWLPLGVEAGSLRNFVFVAFVFAVVVGVFKGFLYVYPHLLAFCLRFKAAFLALPVALILWAVSLYPSFQQTLMPALDEGAFLLMPTTMPHASIGEALDILSEQDRTISAIPEVERVVGKIGRADTALDPAPISMVETYIAYAPEYVVDENGRIQRFKVDAQDEFVRDEHGDLVPDDSGQPFRNWRTHIQSPEDIWQEIIAAASIPGVTSAPKLQPIETRQIMLQTGMRANTGIKVQAGTLQALEEAVLVFERILQETPGIRPASVNAERVIGQPYLVVNVDRARIQRYGLTMQQVQRTVATAIGGQSVSTSIEGRERYNMRVRYPLERRNDVEAMEQVWLTTPDGEQIPLVEVADITFEQGPQMIRTENTFLTSYVTFSSEPSLTDVAVVEAASKRIEEVLSAGGETLPAGVQYRFAGSYEQQQRAMERLSWIIPLALLLILLVLYVQFNRISSALFIFSGVAVAWSGGLVLLYLYGTDWFGNFGIPWLTAGQSMRDIFNIDTVHLSVAVWIGFLALFGIAVDDGVVMATYLKQKFERVTPVSTRELREQVIAAATRRARACLLTSATTILALLPVLSATGRGADLMLPLAIPTVGGLCFVVLSMFIVPVLWSWREERAFKRLGT
ncbi:MULTISPECIES: efflux RND transporter permease subunit [Gammaproteobacteria]|uniref:efflux RND transporter permease subunit n=1 Tax=Gammaproteobacteria TaxID=1236 RepID=UPI000DD09B9C|nr:MULTISPECIES: efflux RND transporter permease subunit [Gammaproteobacteria]RTE86275.1 efflux RND transporter permease subunit [Aliidiomarina sp. B3213]TCZ91626.1 efflux RND transporter permease subunit [Lysobacter sp. N42]